RGHPRSDGNQGRPRLFLKVSRSPSEITLLPGITTSFRKTGRNCSSRCDASRLLKHSASTWGMAGLALESPGFALWTGFRAVAAIDRWLEVCGQSSHGTSDARRCIGPTEDYGSESASEPNRTAKAHFRPDLGFRPFARGRSARA